MASLTVAIMAGGKSSRMGTDKSFVKLDGKPLIWHVIGRVQIWDRTDYSHHQSSRRLRASRLPYVRRYIPKKGRWGIYTASTNSRSAYTAGHRLRYCARQRRSAAVYDRTVPGAGDVVVPRVDGYPRDLHAI